MLVSRVARWNVETGAVDWVTLEDSALYVPESPPDPNRLQLMRPTYSPASVELSTVDFATGKVAPVGKVSGYAGRFEPSGKHFLVLGPAGGDSRRRVSLVDASTGKFVADGSVPQGSRDLGFSPDGTSVGFLREPGDRTITLKRFDVKKWKELGHAELDL